MAYTPNNNPYIPGDPYSYDLKWIVEKIHALINDYIAVNGRVDGLQVSFDELRDYVTGYFDNLDISEEIKEKLDEMVDDGTFEAIIAPYVAQSVAPGINFYGAKTEHIFDATGNYWHVKIPKIGPTGERQILRVGISDNTITSPTWISDALTVKDFSRQKKASVAINGGFFDMSNPNLPPWGSVIIDGQILQNAYDTHTHPLETLGILDDGSWRYYNSADVSAGEMLSDGVIYALAGLGAMITGGAKTANLAIWNSNYGRGRWQTIGYDDDYYHIITTERRERGKLGHSLDDIANIYLALGVSEAYILDGGGSISTNIESLKLNDNVDDSGFTDRPVVTYLYIKKPDVSDTPDYDEDVSFSGAVSEVIHFMRAQGANLTLYKLDGVGDHLVSANDLPINSIGYTYPATQDGPLPVQYWHIFTYGYSNDLKVQLAIRHTDASVQVRSLVGGTWRAWRTLPHFSFVLQSDGIAINDLPPQSTYYPATGETDAPNSSSRWLIYTYGSPTSEIRGQIAIGNNNTSATRFRDSQGTWTSWNITPDKSHYPDGLTVNGITNASTDNLADLGVITTRGYYCVAIMRMTSGDTPDSGSMYMIRYNGTTFYNLTTIHQSSIASGPLLSATGVLTTVSTSTATNYAIKAFRVDV